LIRAIELFAGTGAPRQALKNLGVPHEVVAISEIDKFAVQSYNALHGDTNNLGDITQIEELPKADLWTYGFPCQDISLAGNNKGLDKGSGTRSGLLWEVERLLLKARDNGTLPKYLLLENVKNLIGKNHKANYEAWLAFLSGLGYTTYTKVLNAKNYGVPQNRERVFGVSILGDHTPYVFPEPTLLDKRLKDILEDEVDEKYYLKESTIKSILSSTHGCRQKLIQDQNEVCRTLAAHDAKEQRCVVVGTIDEGKWGKVTEMHQRVYSPEGLSPTITSCGGGNQEKKIVMLTPDNWSHKAGDGTATRKRRESELCPALQARVGHTQQSYVKIQEATIIEDFYPDRVRCFNNTAPTIRAGREGLKVVALRGRQDGGAEYIQTLEERKDDCTNTLTSVSKDNMVLENCTIRKLTPTECWRLMGWCDSQIAKVKAVMSNAQLYRQAGNGIVVSVLEAIFKNLFRGANNSENN